MRARALILFILAGASIPLSGDTSTATITGTITDSGGGVLPGALVIAQDIDTGVARSTTTNPSGVYLLL
jgi:phage baseplate assembly protein gpV